MPGTRRRQRNANDFYRTPPEITTQFLDVWGKRKTFTRILEPAAGDGAMLDPLRARWPDATIDAFDISPQRDDIAERGFFLDESGPYDLIFTNPPYRHALQFAEQGLSMLAPGGNLVLLLRLAFFASKRRSPFFHRHMPTDLYVLSQRPSFLAKAHDRTASRATDFSDYGWFVWKAGSRNRICRTRVL